MAQVLGAIVGVTGPLVALLTNISELRSIYFDWKNPPTATASDGSWQYFHAKSGAEVAKVLTAESADPSEVWGHLDRAIDFHVWYRKGGTKRAYEYKDVSWVPNAPLRTSVYRRSDSIVPLGFGTRDGRPVLVYLEVSAPK